MSDEDKGQDNSIKTTAEYVRKIYADIATTSGMDVREVSCRDINQVLVENLDLIIAYDKLLFFRFFNVIFAQLEVDGKQVRVINIEPVDPSPKLFLPGQRGHFYTMAELLNKTDKLSEELKYLMTSQGTTSCFLSNSKTVFSIFEPWNGDRVLDECEITVFDTLGVSEPDKDDPPSGTGPQ